jgi:hypothetical protein
VPDSHRSAQGSVRISNKTNRREIIAGAGDAS